MTSSTPIDALIDAQSSEFQKYALAIHTASPDLGFALSNFAGDRRHQVWAELGQNTSTLLHQHLAKFIPPQTWMDLAFIAVATGPGGFTGTRLGVVTARTLAQQLNIPLFGVSTLAAVAWRIQQTRVQTHGPDIATQNIATQDIAIQMPAHRGKLYAAIYSAVSDLEFQAVLADAVLDPDQWQQTLDRWDRPYQLIQAEGGLGTTACQLLELAYLQWQQGIRPHWASVLPFYGQSPV